MKLVRFIACYLLVFLAACSTAPSGYVTVPRVPAWIAPTQAATFTGPAIVEACRPLAPYAIVDESDATFTPISHAWLEQVATWSWEFAKATGIEYTPESFDCDKFALGFALAANIAAQRAGVKAQPLLARIYVHQVTAFGGVSAGGDHALNAFLSDRGVYVIDPQTRVLVPLAEYPNRMEIYRIKLGG